MALLTITQVKAQTDRYAGMYEVIIAAMPAILAKMTANQLAVYGDGGSTPSLGAPDAQDTLGPKARAGVRSAMGNQVLSLFTNMQVAALSSYLQAFGGTAAGLPSSVRDVASYVRYSNGCPDPSPLGSGAGSSYAHLLHPSYAALIAALTGSVSLLPPDVVFAPAGVVLGAYHFAGTHFAAGKTLMTAGVATSTTAPYAPATGWKVRCGNLQPDGSITGNVPNGSLFVTLTGMNQAGASVTWRGDAGTGLAAHGDLLATTALRGTDGGANGGTAAPADRLVQITNIARDTTVSSGGTATQGDIDIITIAERASL